MTQSDSEGPWRKRTGILETSSRSRPVEVVQKWAQNVIILLTPIGEHKAQERHLSEQPSRQCD